MISAVKQKTKHYFPAFKYQNYRIFFISQLISFAGSWMQIVAQGYLVFQLTQSAFLVGVVAAIGYLPNTIFALVGGTIVDRFPKKRILQMTQFLSFLLASFLGILIITNQISLFTITLITFLMGLVNAVDQPARLSIVVELVEKKEDIHSATALNMSMFNSARIVGPALAGWIIYSFGIGWTFLLNGLSFLAPLLAYNFIKFKPFINRPHLGTWPAIKEGISYTLNHTLIKNLLFYLLAVSIFGWSYITILPVVAERIFHQNASGLGLLFSSAGVGSVLGAIFASAFARHFNPKLLSLAGGLVFASALFWFSLTSSFFTALVALFVVGLGLTVQNSTIQATIQNNVSDHVRGRVLSIQTLVLIGMHPIGSFQVGYLAEHWGSQFALALGAIIIFASAFWLYLKTPRYS